MTIALRFAGDGTLDAERYLFEVERAIDRCSFYAVYAQQRIEFFASGCERRAKLWADRWLREVPIAESLWQPARDQETGEWMRANDAVWDDFTGEFLAQFSTRLTTVRTAAMELRRLAQDGRTVSAYAAAWRDTAARHRLDVSTPFNCWWFGWGLHPSIRARLQEHWGEIGFGALVQQALAIEAELHARRGSSPPLMTLSEFRRLRRTAGGVNLHDRSQSDIGPGSPGSPQRRFSFSSARSSASVPWRALVPARSRSDVGAPSSPARSAQGTPGIGPRMLRPVLGIIIPSRRHASPVRPSNPAAPVATSAAAPLAAPLARRPLPPAAQRQAVQFQLSQADGNQTLRRRVGLTPHTGEGSNRLQSLFRTRSDIGTAVTSTPRPGASGSGNGFQALRANRSDIGTAGPSAPRASNSASNHRLHALFSSRSALGTAGPALHPPDTPRIRRSHSPNPGTPRRGIPALFRSSQATQPSASRQEASEPRGAPETSVGEYRSDQEIPRSEPSHEQEAPRGQRRGEQGTPRRMPSFPLRLRRFSNPPAGGPRTKTPSRPRLSKSEISGPSTFRHVASANFGESPGHFLARPTHDGTGSGPSSALPPRSLSHRAAPAPHSPRGGGAEPQIEARHGSTAPSHNGGQPSASMAPGVEAQVQPRQRRWRGWLHRRRLSRDQDAKEKQP